jgi:histidine triad (HIT) family protein
MPQDKSEQSKQEIYRDARFNKKYDDIWQSVGKCVFCDLKDKYIFFEENGVVMTISLYAYIDGHFMIVPRRHIRSTKELTQLEWESIRKFSYIAQKIISQVHHVKGMQFIEKYGINAQGTVNEHLHFHCVPFDNPDLCVWNFRKLKYTPLENATMYRQARKKIIDYDRKFDSKYKQPLKLTMVCDLVILSKNNEVLLAERADEVKFIPDTLCLPGGQVDRFDVPLEQELAREVKEETGIDISKKKISLLASRVGHVNMTRHENYLKVKFPALRQFFWNTYLLDKVDPKIKIRPGSDCQRLSWVPLDGIKDKPISPNLRQVLLGLKDEL